MTRAILAALALACVCTPVLAAPTVDLHHAFATGFFVMTLGCAAVALLLCLVRPRPILGVVGIACLAIVYVCGLAPAFAQAAAATVAQPATDTAVVTVPLGTWIASYAAAAQEIVVALIMALITFACRKLPAAAGSVVKGILTQQLVERAIAFGMSTVSGAMKDKTLSVSVGNAVLANALNYVVQHAPEWFVKWAGGPNAIRDHIIALLPMEADASLASSTPTALGTTTSDPVRSLG